MRKRNSNPYTIPMIEVTTNLDWDELHRFNDEFVSRYSDILSQGVDYRNVFERELSCFETGIKYFHIGDEYQIGDRYTIKITCQIEEYAFGVNVIDNITKDDYVEECEIHNDDESEFFFLNIGRQRIQIRPI